MAAQMQARLDQVFSAYVNHHGEEERAQLLKDVDALFEETTDLQEKVNLFKYLPASLTLGHVVETLQIEKDTTPEAGVSKLLKTTLKSTEFPSELEKKKALLLLHECLRKSGVDSEKEGQESLLDCLALCTSDDSAPLPGYDFEELAARAVLNHFKYAMKMGQEPESWQFDQICGLRPVRNLLKSKTREHRLLYELLYVFAGGKCSEYMSFYAQNKEQIETKWCLKNDELTRKVRTLALCTLCSEASEVRYTDIANKLCITLDQVEMFVIDAMSLDLLNAKIDSMAQCITVKSVHNPLLEHTHWNSLSERLLSWYTAVSTLITTLDEVRVQQVKEDRESDRLEAARR